MDESPAVPPPTRATELARMNLSRLPSGLPLDEVFRQICEISAEALGIERVGVWLFIDQDSALRCAHLYERSRQARTSGAILQVADFPRYFASLRIRRAIPAEVAATDPWTLELAAEYLRPLGISSMLDAGIFVDGKLVGVVCHEHVGPPRAWSTEARDFAAAAADTVALRIQSAKLRELEQAFLSRKRRKRARDRSAAMEQLAAGLAHDFRNQLFVIQAYGGLLARSENLPPESREGIEQILAAVKRGTALSRELMEFANPEPAPPSVLDLVKETKECLPAIRGAVGADYDLRLKADAGLGSVLIERTQYGRLLTNLVANACESMPAGGAVLIALSAVHIHGSSSGSTMVALTVRDQGGGMDDTTRRRLFEPYFTTKAKGTGLGMAIVKRIVERVGGSIRIRSKPGQGTTIRVTFPAIRSGIFVGSGI